jgi:hypothetical protein
VIAFITSYFVLLRFLLFGSSKTILKIRTPPQFNSIDTYHIIKNLSKNLSLPIPYGVMQVLEGAEVASFIKSKAILTKALLYDKD